MSPQTSTVFTSIEQLEKIKKHFLMLEAIVLLLCCKIQLSATRQIIYAVQIFTSTIVKHKSLKAASSVML